MSSQIYVSIDVGTIAYEMSADIDFSYLVLSALAYAQEGKNKEYAEKIFKNIFEEEDDTLLDFLESIVKEFKHLKEEN